MPKIRIALGEDAPHALGVKVRWSASWQCWAALCFSFVLTLRAFWPAASAFVCLGAYFEPTLVASKSPEASLQPDPLPVEMDALPEALRVPITGPPLQIRPHPELDDASRRTSKALAKTSPTPTPAPKPKLVVQRLGPDLARVDYVVGHAVKPQLMRLSGGSSLRVVLPSHHQTRELAASLPRRRAGVALSARKLGGQRLALDVRCEQAWDLGRLEATRRGWSLWVRRKDSALRERSRAR